MIYQRIGILNDICGGLAAVEKEFITRVLPDQALKDICAKCKASYPVIKHERNMFEQELNNPPVPPKVSVLAKKNKGPALCDATSRESMSTDYTDTTKQQTTLPITKANATTMGAKASTVLQTWE